jgi:medium-chain acyl-[acyl-carrier-protein] hydrolase
LRLLCFPFAGGGVSAFSTWSRDLPPDVCGDVEVWAIASPGRESRLREPPVTDMDALVADVVDGITSGLASPYMFFGHSMGALVSFEVARALRAAGSSGPAHMAVSAHRAPHLPNRHRRVRDIGDDQLVARLERLGGTPDAALSDSELRDVLLPTIRADLAMCEQYVYEEGEPLTCSMTGFGGSDDTEVSREEIAAWRCHTRGAFALRVLPGGHFFLDSARTLFLRLLARDMRQILLEGPENVRRSDPPAVGGA